MRVQHCPDLQIFYDLVAPFLQQREAANNIMLSIMGDLLRQVADHPDADALQRRRAHRAEPVAAHRLDAAAGR